MIRRGSNRSARRWIRLEDDSEGLGLSSHSVAKNTNAPFGALLICGGESGIGSGRALPLTASTARSEPAPERSRASPDAASFPNPLARGFSSHSVSTNTNAPAGALFVCGGESGIRTHDTLLTYTHFPGVRLRPLGHLSVATDSTRRAATRCVASDDCAHPSAAAREDERARKRAHRTMGP